MAEYISQHVLVHHSVIKTNNITTILQNIAANKPHIAIKLYDVLAMLSQCVDFIVHYKTWTALGWGGCLGHHVNTMWCDFE